LATGATMWAAIAALQQQRVARIVVAAPAASPDTVRELAAAGHTVVTVTTPDPFFGVGRWYDDFGQTTDDEVVALLDDAWSQAPLASDIA
jgi:predicted phosphoribosyltransferase